jgi:heptosyltransferase-3
MRAHGRPRQLASWVLAGFLASTVLFAIDGRTGHVVLLALVPCVAWYRGAPRWRWAMVVGSPLVVLALALSSSAVESRLRETVAPPRNVANAALLTSTEIRMELLRLAAHLGRAHWATGVGFANYPHAHERAAHELYDRQEGTRSYLSMPWIRISNPHSEYLMQLLGGGIVALALFLIWLGLAFRRAALTPGPAGGMLTGVALAFAVGCAFNSMLLNFGEGHLYMALLAWLVAESRWGATTPASQGEFRRILVLATRQIGDVLLTTPLIHAARGRWPSARIEVLGFQGTLGMLRGNGEIDALVEVPAGLRLRALPWLVRLWRRYDLALIADLGDRAHIFGWAAAPMRSGLLPLESRSNWWKRRLLAHSVFAAGDRGARHVACEKRELLAPWIASQGEAPRVIAPGAAPLPEDIQRRLVPGFIVVHAPSMWPYKQWPVQHFQTLVAGLLERDRQVVLTGSASARDRECIAPLLGLARPPRLLDLSGRLDFNQLVTLMRQAALYIGPDTSVSHLAAATGVQVIAILGPTSPVRWGPLPAQPRSEYIFAPVKPMQREGNVTLLQSTLPCVPCGRAGCEDHRQSRSDCLADITAQRVLIQAEALLSSESPAVLERQADRERI